MTDVCRCDYAYIGTQLAGTPTRCERCRGLVDDEAAARIAAVHAEAMARLLGAVRPDGGCPAEDCKGDQRYAAPGRGHRAGCTYPLVASARTPFEAWCDARGLDPETPAAWAAYRSERVPPL